MTEYDSARLITPGECFKCGLFPVACVWTDEYGCLLGYAKSVDLESEVEQRGDAMTEWSIEPRENLPPPPTGSRRGLSLAQAIHDLDAGQAIFVPAREGEDMAACRNRVSAMTARVARTRTDHERNGIWVFKDEVAL